MSSSEGYRFSLNNVSIGSLWCLCEFKVGTVFHALYMQHSTQWTRGFKILSTLYHIMNNFNNWLKQHVCHFVFCCLEGGECLILVYFDTLLVYSKA